MEPLSKAAMRLLVQGFGAREIAKRLKLTEEEARTLVREELRKLKAESGS